MSWPVVALGDIAETALGKMLDKAKDTGRSRVPYLRNVNVQWGRIDTDDVLTFELDDDELDRFEVKTNDLLVCEGGAIGRCAIWRGGPEYIAYQKALHRIRPSDRVDVSFLRYLLEFYAGNGVLSRLATGSTIAHLPQQQLRRVPVPLPSLGEQRRIVQTLEAQSSRLAVAASGIGSVRKKLAVLERSTLDRLFSGPVVRPLGELIEGISAGKSFGESNVAATEGEWGIIKVSAMTRGEFKASENKAVAADKVDPRFEIRKGDLLVSRANTPEYVGASVLVGDVRPKLLLSDKSLRLTPKAGVQPAWLWRALQTPSARRQISDLATGTKASMRNISQGALQEVLIPVAREQAQQDALANFDDAALSMSRLRTEVAKSELRTQHLQRSLLAAAFSGRLSGSFQSRT